MNLAKICVERPALAVMLNLVFIFLGIVSFSTLTMDLFPKVDIPVVNVRTIWRGAAPQEVESQITREVEDAVATISGIKSLESSSLDSVSIVTVRFVSGTDVNFAHIYDYAHAPLGIRRSGAVDVDLRTHNQYLFTPRVDYVDRDCRQ